MGSEDRCGKLLIKSRVRVVNTYPVTRDQVKSGEVEFYSATASSGLVFHH